MTSKQKELTFKVGKNPCGCVVTLYDGGKGHVSLDVCDEHRLVVNENKYHYCSVGFTTDKEPSLDK